MNQTAGVVLCGGQSQRMGQSKAWLSFGGETLLARVLRILREKVNPLIVVAAPDQALPPIPHSVEIYRDDLPGMGPMQGLVVGLRNLVGRAEATYVSSCDVPLLLPEFVTRMIELRGGHAICVPRVGGYYHPLAAVYSLETLPVAEQLLQEKQLRLNFLFEALATRIVSEAEIQEVDPHFQSLHNCNTPADYQKALKELRG